ncbi:psm1, partial [Symbiodinium microadriaticum]
RAIQECEVEEGKLREIRRDADKASIESQRLLREFESVKAERVSRFMKCFKHIEDKINPYYKELTAYDGFEGGSAYLDLDDAEEPYNGGITFTACPPGKRFFPMELLSGGERSMASMALLFALHSFRPPPFMILDEVDAPFDKKNTGSLVSYLKRLSFQCIVISLKDTFFSHSDSIVGVYKDKAKQTSGILSLSLARL